MHESTGAECSDRTKTLTDSLGSEQFILCLATTLIVGKTG